MRGKGRNNVIQQESDKKEKSFLSKFTGIGGIVTIIFACVGAGFAFGRYYARIELAAQMRELENQKQIQRIEYREKIIDIKEQYQKEIFDLKTENNELQLTINKNKYER